MFPILALDLDDTLYPERTYVDGGLRAVAGFLATECGGEAEDIARSLFSILDARGRGRVFDDYLHGVGRYSRRRVDACVRVYREHEPDISLYPAARRLLELMEGEPLYLVTDGNKLVQRRKTLALKLDRHFRKMFITHRHGVEHAKPSTYCFDRLRELEKIEPRELIYVGDNPAKDFVNLNRQGCLTARVRTGAYADVAARPGYEARFVLDDLDELPALLEELRRASRPAPARRRAPRASRRSS